MSAAAVPASALRASVGGPLLPLVPVRAAVLVALVVFGGLHWMAMLDPAEPRRAWLAAGVALLAALGLAGAARLRGAARRVAAVVVGAAALALALLAGGAADELLRPDGWGTLLAGLGRGFEALPGVNVPYRGIDPWTIVALGAGGTALAAVATLLALWPRSGGRTGFRGPALIALVALYAVPAVVLDFDGEFLRGAVLAVLVVAFLRLERMPVGDAPAAGVAAAVAAVAALAAAPLLDGREPWWDYEAWAVDTAAAREVGFSWNHDYSPLDWPRDGRELLRVKARQPAYWKARDLPVFDGRTWTQDPRPSSEAPSAQLPENAAALRAGAQDIRVALRNLRTDTFVTAGVTTSVRGQSGYPLGAGVWAATDGLGMGDTYTARVYAPRPSARVLRATGTGYEDWHRFYRSMIVPQTAIPSLVVTWPAFGDDRAPEAERLGAVPYREAIRDARLERTWALAQELKRGADTPYEYVERVEAYLADGFAYSEAPPAAAGTLQGFLLDAKIGFCQHYSGAAALLLRMGGIPARVATGFTSGSFDEKAREYVVRDLDAHSWVEVWFPGQGWVSRDPTPAAAPARNQPGDGRGVIGAGGLPSAPSLGGERLSQLDEGRAAAADEDGGGAPGFALLGGGALVLGTGGALLARRRRRLPPAALRPMLEFERALRRARFDGGPGLTLSSMERTFAGWPGAAGYVRALREQRYSGRPAEPTREQRRSLRAALARDAGALRAWWALPPRLR